MRLNELLKRVATNRLQQIFLQGLNILIISVRRTAKVLNSRGALKIP